MACLFFPIQRCNLNKSLPDPLGDNFLVIFMPKNLVILDDHSFGLKSGGVALGMMLSLMLLNVSATNSPRSREQYALLASIKILLFDICSAIQRP